MSLTPHNNGGWLTQKLQYAFSSMAVKDVSLLGVVRTVFLNEQQAKGALDMLRLHFSDQAIEMRRVVTSRHRSDEYTGEYDPIGAARLMGAPVITMSSTGGNLVGNSTTLDISLGDADDILALLAEDEQSPARRRGARILATVDVKSEEEAEQAQDIMRQFGGRSLELDRTGLTASEAKEKEEAAEIETDAAIEDKEDTSDRLMDDSEDEPKND